MATPVQDSDPAQLLTSVEELRALLQKERAASAQRIAELEKERDNLRASHECAHRPIVDARIGALWTPGSGHCGQRDRPRGHRDRAIVDAEIAVVDGEIGHVDTEIGSVDSVIGRR